MRGQLTAIALIMWLGCGTAEMACGQTAPAFLRVEGDWTKNEGVRSLEQHLQFANEAVSYGLTYDISIPPDLPPNRCTSGQWAWKIGHVTLGMPAPISANWYTQSFLAIHVDGVSLHDIPATFRAVRQAGPSVLAEGVWETPKGPVHLRLLLRSGDDKLLMQVMLPPQSKAQRLEVKLNAYPQGFPEPRSRRAATATDDMAANARIDLLALKEPWALLYDELYDKEDRGGGPCALVCVPDEVQSAVTGLGPYAVMTTLKAKPGSRKITVGLWDFTGNRDVADARKYLRDAGRMIADDLAEVARADWQKGVPPVRLPQEYARQLAERSKDRRRPTAYDAMTREIVTPHVKLACPLAAGPVRVLVVGPRWHQRETVELAQRLDMNYDTVSFSGADTLIDPRSLYLYNSYHVYGYPRKNEVDVLYDLSAKLAAERDCIVLTGIVPSVLPPGTRQDIVEQVRAGKGLLLFGDAKKFLGELGKKLETVPWQPDVVPLDQLPGIAKLVAEKRPVWSAYQLGKGRVLVFHYSTGNRATRLALTPGLSYEDPDVLGYYDYYHSLVAAGVLWAAGREPLAKVQADNGNKITVDARRDLSGVTIEVMAHDPARGIRERWQSEALIDLPKGRSTQALKPLGPATGPCFVTVWLKREGKVLAWATSCVDRGTQEPRIAEVRVEQTVLEPGDKLSGTAKLSGLPAQARVELELRDSLDRLLARSQVAPKTPVVDFSLPIGQPVTILHVLRVRLLGGGKLLDQRLSYITVPDRSIDDFHFLAWSDGQNHAVRHHINRVLAAGGVDWIDNTGLTGGDAHRAQVYCRNAARYGLASIPYITRIASMQETGRERRPCLHDPRHLKPWTAGLEERAGGSRPYGPPGYTLGDENFLVRRKLDVCTAPPTLAAFRSWLEEQYGSLERLGEAWQLNIAGWDKVMPATFEEVKDTPAHWPRWADHRRFMDQTLTQAHALGRAAIRQADPQARVGFDGVFSLDSWHGYDFYGLCQACDLVQVYALRNPQIEYLRSWHLPDSIRGSWYNHIGNRDETSAKRLAWHLLFHDFNSSWYWTSYNTGPAMLFPDLRPTPQFVWMQQSIDEIKAGIGKLLLHAQRQQDGIAVHYSQASVHAGTLTERNHAQAQWGFAQAVEDLQLQYDMLAYAQIEQGKLAEYKMLLMPASSALSAAESKAIRQFVEKGGTVIADTLPGILDEHCRLLDKRQLDDLFGVTRSGLPEREGATIQLSHADLETQLPLVAFDKKLKAAGAKPWGSADKVPAVLVHQVGKGRAVLLNAAIETYGSLHNTRTAGPLLTLLRRLLALTNIRPSVTVTAGNAAADACEVVRFMDGSIEYVTLVRDNHVAGLEPEEVSIQLPRAAYVCDVRERKSLGKTGRLQTRLVPGEPKVYALLPYAVGAIKVTPVAATVDAGQMAVFHVELELGGAEPAGSHCLRVEVLTPTGQPVRHYAQNVLTESPAAHVRIPLALSDTPGTWSLRATDVASGRSASVSFLVRRPQSE